MRALDVCKESHRTGGLDNITVVLVHYEGLRVVNPYQKREWIMIGKKLGNR